MTSSPNVTALFPYSRPAVIRVKVPGQTGPQGEQGPIDHSYTDAQVAVLQGELNAALGIIDALSPPNLDFSRPAMVGISPPIHRG